jgi:hypothetical protein
MNKMQKKSVSKIAFKVKSKQGFLIKTSRAYWNIITHIKHPSIKGKEKYVKETLFFPDEIRVSKKDQDVYLFYKKYRDKFLCIVAKIHKDRGFIITAYYTRKIKEGELKWKK